VLTKSNEVFFNIFNHQRYEKINGKSFQFSVFGFSMCSPKYRKMIKDFNFLHFLRMMMATLATNKNSFKNKNTPREGGNPHT
jgi:hypothetical protein